LEGKKIKDINNKYYDNFKDEKEIEKIRFIRLDDVE